MSSAPTKVITPKAILSYPHLHQPQPGLNGGKPKYSCALVFPAGSDLSALDAAIATVAEAKWPGKSKAMFAAKGPSALKNPLRNDTEGKGYPDGATFINVRSEQQPGVVYSHAGPDGKPVVMPVEKIRDELYPGAFVRASLAFFAYDTNGNRGVSAALNNIQKIGEGERLDSRVSAENEFVADLSATPVDFASLV